MKTDQEILAELDYESLFNEFVEELRVNKAEAFEVMFFQSWFKKHRRDIWKNMLRKGSPNGHAESEDRFNELSNSIIKIWEVLCLIDMRPGKYRWRTRRKSQTLFHYDIFELS